MDIDKIVVSNRVTFGKKRFQYFAGYEDVKKLALYVSFSKTSAYRKDFDKTKYISF